MKLTSVTLVRKHADNVRTCKCRFDHEKNKTMYNNLVNCMIRYYSGAVRLEKR